MSLKILVVDDASFTRDLIRRTLRKQFPAVE
ncbi:MAG: CheY-like chemotaxis protein, partial [Marinomonas primoryensis]